MHLKFLKTVTTIVTSTALILYNPFISISHASPLMHPLEPIRSMIFLRPNPIVIEEKIAEMKAAKKKEYTEGWTTASVNVRKEPNTDSEILDTYSFNTKIMRADYNDEWVIIEYDGTDAYMHKDYISDEKCEFVDYDVPKNSGFKSYMSYKTITSRSSKQYKMQYSQAYTGTYGIRQINGRYCVAIGSYFTSEMGTLFDLILKNGTVIPCILSDQKSDRHTDSMNIVTINSGCVSEFIVDTSSLNRNAKIHGDISYCNDDWNSPVKTVRVYE